MNPCINIPVLLSATLAMASATSAQISATFIAKTKMIAYASYSSNGAKTSEIPINTDLTGGKSASISNVANASTIVGLSNTSNSLVASIREAGTGRYFSSSTRAFASTGSHQTLLALKSAKPTKATLRAIWTTRITGTSGAYSYDSIDIGNNGSFEFNGTNTTVTKDFPITIDSTGLAIVTRTQGSAAANVSSRTVSYTSTLSIQILPPQSCLFFSHGTPCGPTLTGKNGFEGRVTISVTGGANSGTGVVILGAQRTSVSLPGTSCLLLVQPLMSVPVAFSATGRLSLTGTIPPARPFAIPIQVGSFGTTLGTSNALTIICP